MLTPQLDQDGPEMVDGSMLGLKPGQVLLLQQCGDNDTAQRTGLGIIWPKLSCTRSMEQAVQRDLGGGTWLTTHHLRNMKHPRRKGTSEKRQ